MATGKDRQTSRSIAAYQEYLERFYEKNKDMKEPTAIDSSEFSPFNTARVISHCPRYWSDFGTVYLMKDGTIWETVMNGPRLMIVRFNNESEWARYTKPDSICQFYDQW